MSSSRPALLHRALALVAGCLAVLAASLADAPSASAHPFGEPQTLEVTTEEDAVRLRWRAGAADDLTVLALHLGLVPPDRVLLDGAVLPEAGDAALLAASPAFADYLLERLRVTVAGRDCAGEVLPVADLGTDGAVVSFSCPDAQGAGTAQVEARTLTDLHPAYRTLADGPGGQRFVYDDENPQHTWSLTGAAGGSGEDLGRSALLQIGSAVGIAAAGGVGAAFYVRRRGRRQGVPVG